MEIVLPARRAPVPERWPYRPRPLPDEALGSYVVRLAHGLDLRPITFLNSVCGSGRNLLAQDLDNHVPQHVAVRLAAGTGHDAGVFEAATLAAYVGTLLTVHNLKGRNPWLLPVATDNVRRRRHGLQFCPACLASDPAPYFRRRWRLAFVTSCTTHGTLLRDACPACDAPVQPHEGSSALHCGSCGGDIRSPTVAAARHDHLAWQARLEAGLATGWIEFGGEHLRSHVVFAVMRQIAKLLVNLKTAEAIRRETVRAWGGDASPFEKSTTRQPVEYLRVGERHRLFDLVQRLADGWPHRFAHACLEAGVMRQGALQDMPDPPHVYDRALRIYMDGTPYRSSVEEVAAAAAWLRADRGTATYRDLKAIVGESRAAIYLHMDYERHRASPSRWRTQALRAKDGLA